MFADRESFRLLEPGHAEDWVIALSARDFQGRKSKRAPELGNTLNIPFYSFGSSELDPYDATPTQVIDGYGNPNIMVHVDHDGDGYLTVPIHGKMTRVEAKICIYSIATDPDDAVMVFKTPLRKMNE